LGIIVGAGPVGLYAAFVLLMQGVNVTMYEPRQEFNDRRQVVQVNSQFSDTLRTILNTQDRWIITYPALHEALAKVGCPLASLDVGSFLWPGPCTNAMEEREQLIRNNGFDLKKKLGGDNELEKLQQLVPSSLGSGVQTFPINVIQQVLLELCYKTADDKNVCFHFYRGYAKEDKCNDVENCESCSELSWKEMTNDKCKDSDSKSKHLPNKWKKGRQTGGCKTAPLTGKELDMLLEMNPKYLLLAMGGGIKKDIDKWWNKHINGHNGEVEIDNIMFRKYGIILEDINENPINEIEAYINKSKDERDTFKSSVTPYTNLDGGEVPKLGDQNKFRVFSTVNGGLYLAVLSDAGNTIFSNNTLDNRLNPSSHHPYFNKRKRTECIDCKLECIEGKKNGDCIEEILKTEVKTIYDKIKEVKNPNLQTDHNEDIKISIPDAPHLFHVNTYAFNSNGTVVARIGDSGYNRHFFTGSSMNTGMLSTLDLLTKCGQVRDIRMNPRGNPRNKSPDVEPNECKADEQVNAYNKTQRDIQTLIPKEFESGNQGNDRISRISGAPISLNCNLVKFFDYFVRYHDLIKHPDEHSEVLIKQLVEFKNIFYPDFCQMLKEQGQKNIAHTKQIINFLLQQDPAVLRQKYCNAGWSDETFTTKEKVTYIIPAKKKKKYRNGKLIPVPNDWENNFTNYDDLITYVDNLKNKTLALIGTGEERALKEEERAQEEEERALKERARIKEKQEKDYRDLLDEILGRRLTTMRRRRGKYKSASDYLTVKEFDLEGAKIDNNINQYLISKIGNTKLKLWREVIKTNEHDINNDMDSNALIYKKLFPYQTVKDGVRVKGEYELEDDEIFELRLMREFDLEGAEIDDNINQYLISKMRLIFGDGGDNKLELWREVIKTNEHDINNDMDSNALIYKKLFPEQTVKGGVRVKGEYELKQEEDDNI